MGESSHRNMGDPVQAVATFLRAYPATERVTALARLLETSPNCIIIADVSAEFNCNYLNKAARRRFRVTIQHLAGRPLREILPAGKQGDLLCALRAAVGRMTAIQRPYSDDGRAHTGVADQGELLNSDWCVWPMIDRRGAVKHLMLAERTGWRAAVRGRTDATPNGSSWSHRPQAPVQNRERSDQDRARPALTSREWEVAELVALGLTNRSIAERLFLSQPTVATHVARILGKLRFGSRVQLAAWIAGQQAFNQG
jgi:DNA-binding CsgD family transcriptional regulator